LALPHICILMNQITILFVDKQPLVRKAWDFIMRQDARFKMVATCENGETAIELSKKLNPDIVIVDTNLKGMSGVDLTRWITIHRPAIKVIGLAYHTEEETAHKVLLSGAMGCLSKMSYPEEIFRTIIEVQRGKTYVCKEMKAIPADAPVERIPASFFYGKKVITMNKPRLQECAQ
jgi:DNA-binding NarL/FixJ family response regulator